MSKERIGYMHAIEGSPAYYNGQQIVYAVSSVRTPFRVVPDRLTIKRQQRASRRWRKSQGFDVDKKYMYRQVVLDASERE